MSFLGTRAGHWLRLTNLLLIITAICTAYLSYDGVRLEMAGTVSDNFKAAIFGAAIGISYFVCCAWLINIVALMPPQHQWRQLLPVGLMLVCVIGASSITNMNSLGRELLIEHARNAYISERTVWNDDVKATARGMEGLDAMLSSIAKSVGVIPAEEEQSGRLSNGLSGCGPVCLSLKGLVDRVEEQRVVLREGLANVEETIANLDGAMSRMREAMAIEDPAGRRVALEAANDEMRGYAITLRESLPIAPMLALAAELESASVLGPMPPNHSPEGYAWARRVLRDQGKLLREAVQPIADGVSTNVPTYTERNGFQLALEVGLIASPSLFLAAIGIDLMTPIIALMVMGVARATLYPSATRTPDDWPTGGGTDDPFGGVRATPGAGLDGVEMGARVVLEAVRLGSQLALDNAAKTQPHLIDLKAATQSEADSPEAGDDFQGEFDFEAAPEPQSNGHDFGGPYPRAAESRAQAAKRRREARKANGGAS